MIKFHADVDSLAHPSLIITRDEYNAYFSDKSCQNCAKNTTIVFNYQKANVDGCCLPFKRMIKRELRNTLKYKGEIVINKELLR